MSATVRSSVRQSPLARALGSCTIRLADERLRELERRWQESGAEEDGWALIYERMRGGGMLTRLLQHVVRFEMWIHDHGTGAARRTFESRADVPAEVILEWLDRERPTPPPASEVAAPAYPPPIPVRLIAYNRGYSRGFLNRRCGTCGHERGHHERPPEERGRCTIGGCGCTIYALPP